jgi:nitrate reductase beta subunit
MILHRIIHNARLSKNLISFSFAQLQREKLSQNSHPKRHDMSAELKFRPSLTASQISYLLNLLQTAGDSEAKEIARSLHKFHLKAKHGIVAASHVKVSTSLQDSLGFTSESVESLYEIWKNSPASLSPAQLSQVSHYRYTSDLMNPTEEAAYECGQLP